MKQLVRDFFWGWLRVVAGVLAASAATGGAVLCFSAFFVDMFTVLTIAKHLGMFIGGTFLIFVAAAVLLPFSVGG